jgi:ubiquinone/menaquinone biosynthesis C-methylase UbiE
MARHLWYTNLELTLEQLSAALKPGQVLIDYSGGTGILARQLLQRVAGIGVVMVDASPRFLRVALEHFREQPRVAFRLLNYLESQRRLQRLDEVLEPALVRRGVDGLVSTNAVHLYPDLEDTFQAWARVVRPGGKVFVQSGDIRNPEGKPGEWLISEVVAKVREVAREVAAGDPRYAPYREVLANPEYREALTRAGFTVTGVISRTVDVGVLEWYEATSVYPDLLAWVGGSPKVDRRQPTPSELQDRLDLLKQSFLKLFSGRDVYQSTWTYLAAEK